MARSIRVGIGDDGPNSLNVLFLVFAEFGTLLRRQNEGSSLGTTISKDDAFLYEGRISSLQNLLAAVS